MGLPGARTPLGDELAERGSGPAAGRRKIWKESAEVSTSEREKRASGDAEPAGSLLPAVGSSGTTLRVGGAEDSGEARGGRGAGGGAD